MGGYDFLFAGGGLAGLSLAYHLATSPLRERSILIVDREAKDRNDRTWCFWTDRPTPFDCIVHRSWDRLAFVGEDFEKVIPLGEYRYKLIRGIDFYRFAQKELKARANVQFLQGTVEEIESEAEGATVTVDGARYGARWVFDSRFKLSELEPYAGRGHFLKQIFKGWLVETQDDAFRTEAPLFMDLRTPQEDELRFFYVLPYSARAALVEFVTLSSNRHAEALEAYLGQVLGIKEYTATPVEGGVNPLTDYAFPRQAGEHVMNIGTRGGRVKGSTGYAFLRIQQDSTAIVTSLLQKGHPFHVSGAAGRYRLYDSLMLDILQRHGGQGKSILTALFKNNPIERVLAFLDETAPLAENSRLIASLPPRLFLESLFRLPIQA